MEKKLYIIAGLSGAGKSTALRAFEDLNYFTADGLPGSLAPQMAAMLPAMERYNGMALGLDLRDDKLLQGECQGLAALANEGFEPVLIFLSASNTELLRRYATTRRPHPLEKEGLGLEQAVLAERERLKELKKRSNYVIDTSAYSIHDLRRRIHHDFGSEKSQKLRVVVLSFGFKYGLPPDADYVFDLRFLPNPFFVPEIKTYSGLDQPVVEYLFKFEAANIFLAKLTSLFEFILPQMSAESRSRVTIALGCTGGRHRSVAISEKLGQALTSFGYHVELKHRNLESDLRSDGKN